MGFTVVEADIARPRPIGDRNVGRTITVQIRENNVPRGPIRIAEGSAQTEMSRAIVQQNYLRIGRVVADNHVERAVSIQIGERSRIAAIGFIRQRWTGREMTLAVAKKHYIG